MSDMFRTCIIYIFSFVALGMADDTRYDDSSQTSVFRTGSAEVKVTLPHKLYHLKDTLEAEVSLTCIGDSSIFVPDPDSYQIEFSSYVGGFFEKDARMKILAMKVRVSGTMQIYEWDKLVRLRPGQTATYGGRLPLVSPEFWMADTLLLVECLIRYTLCWDKTNFLMRGNEWIGSRTLEEYNILEVQTYRFAIRGPFIYLLEPR